MTPWTLTMCCPLDGTPFELVNQIQGDHMRILTIVECGNHHQWEVDVLLARHAVPGRRRGRP